MIVNNIVIVFLEECVWFVARPVHFVSLNCDFPFLEFHDGCQWQAAV